MSDTERTNLDVAREIVVSPGLGGVLTDTGEKLWVNAGRIAAGGFTVPEHYRNNQSACYVMMLRAANWGMDPVAVLDQTYVVKGRIGYQSLLVHALIEQRSAVKGRLRHDFMGDGADLQCKVWGIERETGEVLEWVSPKLSDIEIKNSSEWVNNPKKQLYYHTSRDWARVYFPEILLGIYTREELESIGPESAKDVTPKSLIERLNERLPEAEAPPDPEEQAAQEQAALAQAQEKKRRHGEAIKEGRQKAKEARAVSMRDLPQFQAPEVGFGEEIEMGVGTVPEPAPAGTAGPLRGIPSNQSEYIEYAQGQIADGQSEGWFNSLPQQHLRQMCQVTDLADKMLRSLIQELPQ